MSYEKKFDFKRFLSLGREVSEKHKEFKFLAPLGHEAAEQRAALEFMRWLKKQKQENNGVSVEAKLAKAIELLGKAELLPFIKEVGRFCLILGDTSHKEDWVS